MKNSILEKSKVFPQEMKDMKIWCNWRFSTRANGDKYKMPLKPFPGGAAKANDSDTWSDFETVMDSASEKIGVGLFITEPYVGIDLDDVEDELNRHLNGDFEDNIVSEFANSLDTYTEKSPSGTGIHAFVKGKLPEKDRQKGNVEMYNDGRFFTVTFESIGPDYIRDDSDTGIVGDLHTKYLKREATYRPKVTSTSGSDEQHDLSNEQVVRKAIKSKNGEKFKDLLEGNWEKYKGEGQGEYPSHSEADMGFTNMLAFWTAKDAEQMDDIFRNSGMYRDKWDEMRGHDSYGNIVIDEAISGTANVYTERVSKSKTYQIPDNTTKVKDSWKMNQDEPTREDMTDLPLRSADDTGNAERLVDRYGDILKYEFTQEKFYVYNGQVWDTDDMGQARRLVNQTVEMIEDEDWSTDSNPVTEKEEEVQKKIEKSKTKHVSRSRSRAGKTNMLELAQTYVPVSIDEFDQDDFALNVENGYVDLRTGETKRSDKDKMFSMMSESEVKDDVGEPTQWLAFLDKVMDGNQEHIDFIQRALGYTLTGSSYEQVMFILYGKGKNGKSKFIEVIQSIMGSYTMNVQANALAPRADNTINNDIAKLKDIRMATSSEPNDGFQFDEGLIKQITGDEVISARFLYSEEFDFMPKFKLWLTTNYKPVIKGTDDGIWRRLVIIPFDVVIAEEEREKDIAERLLDEKEAILNWMIEGAVEWYKDKDLRIPESILGEKDEYRRDMDVFGEFIDDNCEVGSGKEVRASELWATYKEWSDDGRFRSLNKNEFGVKMKRDFDNKRKSDGMYYLGLDTK